MSFRWTTTLALAVMLMALGTGMGRAQNTDWPMYNHDLHGTRHSPLSEINTDNVGDLAQAWSFNIGRLANSGGLTGGSEATPIVVDGVMFLPLADAVIALDAATGGGDLEVSDVDR